MIMGIHGAILPRQGLLRWSLQLRRLKHINFEKGMPRKRPEEAQYNFLDRQTPQKAEMESQSAGCLRREPESCLGSVHMIESTVSVLCSVHLKCLESCTLSWIWEAECAWGGGLAFVSAGCTSWVWGSFPILPPLKAKAVESLAAQLPVYFELREELLDWNANWCLHLRRQLNAAKEESGITGINVWLLNAHTCTQVLVHSQKAFKGCQRKGMLSVSLFP